MVSQKQLEAQAKIKRELAQQEQQRQMELIRAKQEQILTNNVLQTLQAVETKMDEDLKRLSDLGNLNESELDRLRDQRKERMQQLAAKRSEWRANGHGSYQEVRGEKEFFREVKESERVVVHFFRNSSFRCNVVDKHLGDLAMKHLETKFIKIDAEKSPFLVERLKIWMMPSILIVLKGKTEHTICGFDEFGGIDDFSTEMCAYILGKHKALFHDGNPPENPSSSNRTISRFEKSERSIRQSESKALDDDADWWD